jgi:hypothetical protein
LKLLFESSVFISKTSSIKSTHFISSSTTGPR